MSQDSPQGVPAENEFGFSALNSQRQQTMVDGERGKEEAKIINYSWSLVYGRKCCLKRNEEVKNMN